MKRVFGYLSCAMLLFSLCGCAQDEAENGAMVAPSSLPTLSPSATPTPDFSGPTVGTSGVDTADDDPYQLTNLTTNVDTAISQAEKSVPQNEAEQDKKTYLDSKSQLSAVETKVGQAEDQLELDYRAQKIDENTYRSLDKQLKQMELKLEEAEDQLEQRFGMVD